MKKITFFTLFCLLFTSAFSKKDPEAWKTQKTLESQYSFFKTNSSAWNGYLMTKEPQLNEFHKSIIDTVNGLEKQISQNHLKINTAQKEISSLTKQLKETQTKLEQSLSKENELSTLGMSVNKNSFPTILYSIIALTLLIAIIGFILFFRSNIVTKETEKRYLELTEEFKTHKAKAMDRETKLRRELQTERNKNHNS